jgi:adenylate kinase family enzyme
MGAPPSKIHVRGTTGSGKSTFAAELAQRLGVKHIELDALHHGPNWAQPTAEEFRERVVAAIAAAPNGWVIDGNYDSKLGSLVEDAADAIVWIDPPFHTVIIRLLTRTLHRVWHDVELWNGNRESLRTAFWGRDALIWWTVRAYFRHRRLWAGRGYIRLRSERAKRAWLEQAVTARTGSRGS